MAILEKNENILRELAEKVAEIANLPVQKEKAEMWRRHNRLERVKPMVLLHNSAWNETMDDSVLETNDNWRRGQERAPLSVAFP